MSHLYIADPTFGPFHLIVLFSQEFLPNLKLPGLAFKSEH